MDELYTCVSREAHYSYSEKIPAFETVSTRSDHAGLLRRCSFAPSPSMRDA